MNNTLIAYYSFSGTTRLLAEHIAKAVSGTLLEIIPEKPYSFDYNTATKEARAQIARGFCPKLIAGGDPIDEYDAIFIGSPNWFKSIAPPVLTFLRGNDFSSKTVIPFCTHGGGGFGEIEHQIAAECSGATLLPGLGTSEVDPVPISAWLAEIGLLP